MDSQHKAVRALLSTMAPKRAVNYILSFELPRDEELCLIEHDVRGKSYIQICQEFSMSPETVKKHRQKAFAKIVDGINNL